MELDKYRELPLYQKAEEILNMVHRIIELIPEENEMLKSTGDFMMADVLKLPAKIAGAEGADLYDIRMEIPRLLEKVHGIFLYPPIIFLLKILKKLNTCIF